MTFEMSAAVVRFLQICTAKRWKSRKRKGRRGCGGSKGHRQKGAGRWIVREKEKGED